MYIHGGDGAGPLFINDYILLKLIFKSESINYVIFKCNNINSTT